MRTWAWVILVVCLSPCAFAQYFGQNKVQYHRFDWKVIHTDHFDVHYYGSQRQAALDAARFAEQAYADLQDLFGHGVEDPIPLLLYASHGHFAETNVTPYLIPEGTGGITELVKRRVFLPFTGSYAELFHVLKHELVHAFQIDRMLGSGRSLLGSQVSSPPLWFIEGMAEYYSMGRVDPATEMWLRDAALHGYLVDLETLSRVEDIRVYRFGQSVMAFLADRYGKEKVGELWNRLMGQTPLDKAVERTLGMSVEDLSKKWQLHVRRTYLPQVAGRDSPREVGTLVAGGDRSKANFCIAPALSPGGDKVAYLSDETMFVDLYVRDDQGRTRRLVKGARSGTFESLRFLSTTVAWSPDGSTLAVSVESGGKEGIYLVDASTGRVKERLFPPVDGVQGPCFSRDGTRLAFVGLRHGQSDLFVYHLQTKTLEALTDDRYAERDPTWSPGDRFLAFATDRSPHTDFETMAIAPWGIALMDLSDKSIRVLPRLQGKHIDPEFSPDGRYLAFVSDADGVSNIYVWDLQTQMVGKVTNVFSGVAGLTPSSPCLSWANEVDRMAFSAFEGGMWNVYTLDGAVDRVKEWHPVQDETVPVPLVVAQSADTATFAISPYRVRLTPDYLAGGAYYASNTGLMGQSYVSFSDVLGNHTVTIGASLYGSLTDSDLLVAYTNLSRRLNWGAAVYQYRTDYLYSAPQEEVYLSEMYRGGQVGLLWPFSRFSRVELNLALLSIHQETYLRTVWDPNYFYEVDDQMFFYAEPGLAWVTDNTLWGSTGPIAGRRGRAEVSWATGDVRCVTSIVDLRQYLNLSRDYLFAFRTVVGASEGPTPRVFSIGGASTVRGFSAGSLRGTRAMVSNAEFRFPLVHRLWLGFPLSLDIREVRGCVFLDAGAAWDKDDFSPFTKDPRTGLPKAKDLKASFGLGARLNLGIFVLKYDLARRTDLVSSLGAWRSIWTLGTEF